MLDEVGLTQCIARGAAKSQKRFSGSIEPFTSGQFVLRKGRGRPNLESVSHVVSRFALTASLEGVSVASCGAQWLLRVSYGGDDARDYRAHYEWLLDALLQEGCQGELLLLGFEVGLLGLMGFMPDPKCCCSCGESFDKASRVELSASDGAFVHGNGAACGAAYNTGGYGSRIGPDVLSLFGTLCSVERGLIGKLRVSKGQMQVLSELVGRLLRFHTGVWPSSRALVFGKLP